MKYRNLRHNVALIGLVMLFFSLSFVVGVDASTIDPIEPTLAHKTPITFEFTNNAIDGAYERLWFSKHGTILHARGWDHIGDVWGGLEGTLTYVGDINFNMLTYDGTGGGTVCFTVNYEGLSGNFEGRMVIKVNGGYITGMFVCHGEGDFEGMHLKGTCEGAMGEGAVYSANAVLLNPKA